MDGSRVKTQPFSDLTRYSRIATRTKPDVDDQIVNYHLQDFSRATNAVAQLYQDIHKTTQDLESNDLQYYPEDVQRVRADLVHLANTLQHAKSSSHKLQSSLQLNLPTGEAQVAVGKVQQRLRSVQQPQLNIDALSVSSDTVASYLRDLDSR